MNKDKIEYLNKLKYGDINRDSLKEMFAERFSTQAMYNPEEEYTFLEKNFANLYGVKMKNRR